MENNTRPRTPVARHVQRPVQYGRTVARPVPISTPQEAPLTKAAGHEIALNIRFGWPKTIKRGFNAGARLLKRTQRLWHRYSWHLHSVRVRVSLLVIALVMIISVVIPILQPHLIAHTYALGQGESLLQPKDSFLASKISHDAKTGAFDFNANYSVTNSTTDVSSGGPVIKASINEDPSKGLVVTDPLTQAKLTLTPKFNLLSGKQSGNRVVYPLADGTGWVVYTMGATQVKEDVILRHANGDTMKLKYSLDLAAQGLEAHLQADGSVAIYGSDSVLGGQVNTGDAKDAALLQKAREHEKKTKYMFSLPAPVVYQDGHVVAQKVHSRYVLDGETLTTVTTGLKQATFPLDVDPAVTVIGTSDLFRDTNSESNVDLDASTGNIGRGKVTGGVVTTSWTTNANNLTTGRFLSGAAINDDYAYVAGGAAAGSTSNTTSVEFAAMSKANASIGTWGSTTALPVALSRFQLIAYNGYLYAIGGSVTDTTCTTVTNKIYYNRIQNNGQLSSSWTDNSTVSGGLNLPASLCGFGATIYNNKLYIAGGRTGSGTGTGSTATYYATINPNGSITTAFTTEDSTLPAPRYDADLKIYNDYAYVVGGTLAGTATNTVLLAPLATDGSLYGGAGTATWKSAPNMISARTAMGGTLAAVNDGYMYVDGGCNTLNGSQTCTTASTNTQSDIEVAQINADGTLGSWSNIATSIATDTQIGGNLEFWRGSIYIFAGCSSISTSAVQCTTALNTQRYDTIATPGQLGPLHNGTSLSVGLYDAASVVTGGYVYVIGGCKTAPGTNSCQTGINDTSNVTYYALINADGTIGSWNTSGFTLNGGTGLSGMGAATYNGYIYLVGGYSYGTGGTTSTWIAQTNPSTGNITANWSTTGMDTVGATLYNSSVVVFHGYLFSFGGCIATATTWGCGTYRNQVYSGQIAAGTGLIATMTARGTAVLPTATAAMGGAVYNGYMYLAGGATGSLSQTTSIMYAKITISGAMTWGTTTGVMPNPLRRANAYAMNGYLYVTGGHNAAGNGGLGQTYGTIDIGKINLSTGNIDSNLTSSVIQITPRWDPTTVFSSGRLYIIAGCSNGNPPTSCATSGALGASKIVEYVEIYNAGNKGTSAWSVASNNYTTNRTDAASVAYNGYIYIAGGCSAYTVASSVCTAGANYLNTIYYAPLNPDGSIGTWAAGGTLTAALSDSCMVGVGGYLYVMGGRNSTPASVTTVSYSAVSSTTGVPNTGTWSTTTALGTVLANESCASFNGYIYTTGGENTAGTAQTRVNYSSNVSAGGPISSWTSTTAFTTARYNHISVIGGGYLYVMGGYTGSAYLQDVQSIALDPTTGIPSGSWSATADLPLGVQQQTGFVANGYIYLSGGRTASTTCTNVTWVASINSPGTTSEWSQAVNNFTTARFGAGGGYYAGYYYTMGGDDCTSVITSNIIQYGGEQSQAMRSIFSKYADFNGDGDPEKLVIYLTNAVNNGVDIEEWKMNYLSSRELANSWGVTTTVSPLVNQNAYSINAYDGSSIDQVIARWFYLRFSIDMTQSFTFTDDTQPTIYQYGLHYAPPPSKRLLHGRDFRDQTQQGEDLKL